MLRKKISQIFFTIFKQKVAEIKYRENSKIKVSREFKIANWLKHSLFCFMLNSNLAYYSLNKSSVDKYFELLTN